LPYSVLHTFWATMDDYSRNNFNSEALHALLNRPQPKDGDEEARNVTQQQIQDETRKLEQEVLASQQRSIATLDQTEQVAAGTLQKLAEQSEIIDGVAVDLDAMERDIFYADTVLQKIASPLAFLRLKKQSKLFEEKFGRAADWSGPLLKKRDHMPGYKKRYFVIVSGKLMYFDSTGVKMTATTFENPRGMLYLKGAEIIGEREKLEILVKSGKSKWPLRCADPKEYFGWYTMLSQFASGKRTDRKRDEAIKAAAASGTEASADTLNKATTPSAPTLSRNGETPSEGLENVTTDNDTILFNKPTTQVTSQKDGGESLDDLMNKNFDLMLNKMNNLGAMALEQQHAIDVQNSKLEDLHTSVEQRGSSLSSLQQKHRRRMFV